MLGGYGTKSVGLRQEASAGIYTTRIIKEKTRHPDKYNRALSSSSQQPLWKQSTATTHCKTACSGTAEVDYTMYTHRAVVAEV